MDKQTIIQAADHYVSCRVHEKKGNMPSGYAGGIHEGFEAGAEFALPKWIPVSEQLPEKNCSYGASVLATDGKTISVCVYTSGKQIDVELENDEDDEGYDFDEKSGNIYLKAGWYECQEQSAGLYDEVWMVRKITHWMTLPSLPKP